MPIHADYRPIASFASKAVIHPSYIPQESKAVIHPSYRPKDEMTSFGSKECEAGGDSNDIVFQVRRYSMGELISDHLGAVTAGVERDNLTDAGLVNNSAYVDEDVDGFMKLGDIKGEFAGSYSNSLGGWEAASDIWTTGGPSTFKAGHSYSGGGTVTCGTNADFTNADALVQQVNGTIGYEMQPAEFFSHAMEWFAPGRAVDALGASTPMGIEPNHMISGGSSGGHWLNELRTDNRF